MSSYPAHREAVVVLRDGSTVQIRPIRPEDAPMLLSFLEGISRESLYLRFFSGGVNIEEVVRWGVDVDYEGRFGLVALAGQGKEIAAHASYIRTGPDRAEVGLEVADRFQGMGLGTILLAHLAEAAEENGIATFKGHVLAQNHRMIEVFRESGFPVRTTTEPGEILFELPTSLSADGLERFQRREQTATVAALKAFLSPASVAIVGAGRERGTIGGEILHNLLSAQFAGPVYPVNPKAEFVQSVVAYPSVLAIPEPVDLAVIVVPADAVLDAARECGEKGIRALVVISSGFGEVGERGRELERNLLSICRDSGMRLIGPNCMGIINTAPEVNLNATFAPGYPPRGSVGFLSQSGALGLAVIDQASSLGLGISSFVSVGNKADISGNDLILYWDADEDTELILLYLESVGNPRKFASIARRVGKRKPIIAVKSGRSPAGARATSSHTGAMLAASDVTVDALFTQAGVIRTDTLAEMFDVASLLANQPAPSGNRVAIVTNAGGPGILCADTCEAGGLSVPPLPEEIRDKLAGFLPAEASLSNPIDMIASATAEDYRLTIEVLAGWDGVDALIVIFIPPLVTRAEDVAAALVSSARSLSGRIPVLSVFMSSRGAPAELRDTRLRIPTFAFPEEAAHALIHAVQYGVWRERPQGNVPVLAGVRADEAAGVVASALSRGGGWLTPTEAWRLLSCYGMPLVDQEIVATPEEAGDVAKRFGGRVALKAIAPDVLHKTEAGAVRVGLSSSQVARTAEEMRDRIGRSESSVEGFVVQRMARPGVEAIVGVVSDPVFGTVLACGAGGTAVELLKDVSVRIAPITDTDAFEMIRSLKTFPLFNGYRGAPPADVATLEQALLRASAMVEAHDAVVEMDLNPVIVHAKGASIVDARIRVETRPPRRPMGARRDV